ncbi:MAG TPA: hypothetical protein VGC95_13235, partial [Chitinophagaceae bacterium]
MWVLFWRYKRSGPLSRLLALLFAGFFFPLPGNAQGASFQKITYPSSFPIEIVNDVQNLLHSCTGRAWDVSGADGKTAISGFILELNTSNSYKTGESCMITGDGSTFQRFEAPTTNGLIYGIYKYLRDLGFRFYLPDDLYTITPNIRSVYQKCHRVETPFLRIREFFGTGGFGSGKTDPGKSVEKAWQLWKWRNGFGAEFYLSGHVGETFNLDNADQLVRHPDWTATPVKKNGSVDQTTKLNYFNADAVNFFTDWALRKFTAKSYQPPPAYIRDMVSVEPADGGGYITKAPRGSRLSSVSDQVFNAANVAAAKLDRLFPNQPNIGVNLYAYSGHADVPSFKLNPRVFVQIIPYQFQDVAFGPTFIRRWAAQVKRFGLYDYFKYPDASWDMPGGYTLDELMKRAVNAVDAGSEGTTYETSDSKFSTAIPLWIVGRYFCTGDENWEQAYNTLITDLYGSAGPAIKRLFSIFYRQVQFDAGSFNSAVEDIANARQQVKDKNVSARIDELQLYLSYVYLRLNSQDTKNGNLQERLLPLAKMAWTLYQKKIIDSYRIMQLVSYSFLNAPATEKGVDYH